MTHTKSIFFLSVLVACATFGCYDINEYDDIGVEGEGEFAISIANADATIEDIVGELESAATMSFDPDGLVHLIYEDSFTQQTQRNIFEFIPASDLPVPDSSVSVPLSLPNEVVLDYATLQSGTLEFNCSSNYNEGISLQIILPGLTEPATGEPYTYSANIAANGSAGATFDLSGWNLSLPDGQLQFRYIALLPDGMRVTLPNFNIRVAGWEANYIQGYLGSQTYDLSNDTVRINFFQNWLGGNVYFEDPSVTVLVDNSFGYPMEARFSELIIQNYDGSQIVAQGDFINEGILFDYPNLDEVGQSIQTMARVDNTNSNITDIFSNRPSAVDYELDIITHPDNDPSFIGFATRESRFRVDVLVDMPFRVDADYLMLRETSEVSPRTSEDYDFVDYVELKVYAENSTPIDMTLQLYFLDAEGGVLDSLFDTPRAELIAEHLIIGAAPTDAQGYSTDTRIQESIVELDESKYDAFLNAHSVELVTVMDNTPDEIVRLRRTDNIILKIGAKAGIHY